VSIQPPLNPIESLRMLDQRYIHPVQPPVDSVEFLTDVRLKIDKGRQDVGIRNALHGTYVTTWAHDD